MAYKVALNPMSVDIKEMSEEIELVCILYDLHVWGFPGY